MPNEVKLLPCEDLSDDKCAICGKHKSRHSTGSGYGVCQIYPIFVSEREMLERLTRPTIVVTDEVVERVALGGFQAGVDKWMDACFTPAIKADVQERCDRFVEESLEFVQAAGYSAERAHALVDYTFGRPTGEINQEVGGVMVTLAAMCNTVDVDIGAAAETELARVWTKIDVIRAKQAAKPTGAALPLASMPTVVTGEQPLQSVGDHALPPSGLSRVSPSQAKPAAAIARKAK